VKQTTWRRLLCQWPIPRVRSWKGRRLEVDRGTDPTLPDTSSCAAVKFRQPSSRCRREVDERSDQRHPQRPTVSPDLHQPTYINGMYHTECGKPSPHFSNLNSSNRLAPHTAQRQTPLPLVPLTPSSFLPSLP